MKTLIFFLLMFAYLSVSGQSPFTYTEIKNSISDTDAFIEMLINEKRFEFVQKHEVPDSVVWIDFAKDYNAEKKISPLWISVTRYLSGKGNIIMHFVDYRDNYDYLTDRIKQDCEKVDFSFSDDLGAYVNTYRCSDSLAFVFYKEYIAIYNF